MAVPVGAPVEVYDYWAKVPNCAEIRLFFKPLGIGPSVGVKCEGWGQLANDEAATMHAIYHIKNRRPMWWARYAGWEEINGPRKGYAPPDFYERYRKHWGSRKPPQGKVTWRR